MIDIEKLIFLDIDGVMNCKIDWEVVNPESTEKNPDVVYFKGYSRMHCMSKRCIKNLNKLIQDTGAKLVISSTWRKGINQWKQLPTFFKEANVIGEIIGRTPVLDYPCLRGNEIRQWLEDNRKGKTYRYVILDDDSDMLYWQRDNFICVDGYAGLTESISFQAERILNQIVH